jgi:hypothetical protein
LEPVGVGIRIFLVISEIWLGVEASSTTRCKESGPSEYGY